MELATSTASRDQEKGLSHPILQKGRERPSHFQSCSSALTSYPGPPQTPAGLPRAGPQAPPHCSWQDHEEASLSADPTELWPLQGGGFKEAGTGT